jgi:ribosome-binding factor A
MKPMPNDEGSEPRSRKPESLRKPEARKPAPRVRAGGPLGPSAEPSDRPAQVAGEVRRALQAELARGLNDPRVQGMISITEVVLTPDLAEARVRVSVLPEDRASLTLSGLRAAAGFLRRRVMDGTRIGRVPRIEFELDDRMKRQAALDAVIRDGGSGAQETTADGSAEGTSENTTR